MQDAVDKTEEWVNKRALKLSVAMSRYMFFQISQGHAFKTIWPDT